MENWRAALRLVPLQNQLKREKMETFRYKNLKVKVLSQQN